MVWNKMKWETPVAILLIAFSLAIIQIDADQWIQKVLLTAPFWVFFVLFTKFRWD